MESLTNHEVKQFSYSGWPMSSRGPPVFSTKAMGRFCHTQIFQSSWGSELMTSHLHIRQLSSEPPLQLAKTFFKKRKNDNNFNKLGVASDLISCFKSILVTLYRINSKT